MELGILYAFMFALYLFMILELIAIKAMGKDLSCMHDMMHDALHIVLGGEEVSSYSVEEVVTKDDHEKIQAWDES